MKTREDYKMSVKDLDTLLATCQPVPYMVFGGHPPRSPQENVNIAWAVLGKKMGFDPTTVQPTNGKGQQYFSAIPLQRVLEDNKH